jgi:hypothetical protein
MVSFSHMILSVSGKHSVRILSHWVLILVLLLGQSIALEHDHEADSNSDETCALCLYAQQSDNVLPASTLGVPANPSPVCVSTSCRQQPVAVSI